MIRVIAFDLDDTLWDIRPVMIAAEKHLHQFLVSRVPHLQYDRDTVSEIRAQVIESDPAVAHQLTELRRRVIEQALIKSRLAAEEAGELSVHAMEEFLVARNTIEFFDGVLDVLSDLANSYTLGALTNGNADIRRLGLDAYFEFAFSAEDVGAPKPAHNLFRHAMAHNDIDPHQMVYVGDNPILDVDAANAAGLHTVWVNNRDWEHTGSSEPDETIAHVRELPEAVERIKQRLNLSPQ